MNRQVCPPLLIPSTRLAVASNSFFAHPIKCSILIKLSPLLDAMLLVVVAAAVTAAVFDVAVFGISLECPTSGVPPVSTHL